MTRSQASFLLGVIIAFVGFGCQQGGGPSAATGADAGATPDSMVGPVADAPTSLPGVDSNSQPEVPEIEMPGTPDAGPGMPEAGAPEAGNGACPYAFCEDFEGAQSAQPPDPARWVQDVGPDTVDGMQPHSGRLALHVPPNNGGTCGDVPNSPVKLCSTARFVRMSDAFPASVRQKFYGRVWFYVARQPTEGHGADYHWTLLEAGAGTSYYGGLAVRIGGHLDPGGVNWLRFHLETQMLSDPNHETGLSDTQAVVKPKTWTCIEWYYDGPGSEAMFWMDGVERPKLHWKGPIAGRPQWTFPTEFKSFAVGWREYQGTQTPWEVFVDDLVLDTKRIGCN